MKTVASILREARQSRGESFGDVSRTTKIHPKFLKALERGNYSLFSSPVHLKGFLKTYSGYLGLDIDEVLAFWRRDYKEEYDYVSNLKDRSKPLITPWLSITPSTVAITVTVAMVLAFFGYLLCQYSSFASAPKLVVDSPSEDIRQRENTVNVFGKINSGSVITINGQELEINPDGEFATTVGLSEGVNTLSFVATNQVGKQTKLNRVILVEPENLGSLFATSSADLVDSDDWIESSQGLVIKTGPNACWIRVSVGDNILFEGMLVAGVIREFDIQGQVKVQTGNAGSTQVFVNGSDKGTMGREGEVVEKDFNL